MITFDGDVARDLQYSLDYQHMDMFGWEKTSILTISVLTCQSLS